jgi:predicted alpha-1,2-mannosidase
MTHNAARLTPLPGDRPPPPFKPPVWKRVLKLTFGLILFTLLLISLFVAALAFKYHRIISAKPGQPLTLIQPGELGRWVNPFIGTGGIPWVCGENFPGAMVPFGMVRLGPETASLLLHKRALNTSGYYYGDEQLLGFSHTRLNGTGATDGGHFLVTPTLKPANPRSFHEGWSTTFSHAEEVASPGYYAVRLPKLGVLAELTATPRVGVHRYTFNSGQTPHLVLNVMNALGERRSSDGTLRILPEASEIEGAVTTFGTFSGRYGGLRVYFAAQVSPPWTNFAAWQDDVLSTNQTAAGRSVGVDLSFPRTNQPQIVTLKLGISYVSVENARINLHNEASNKPFTQVLAEAQQSWEEKLSLIRIQGGTAEQKRIFYTALFRIFQMPTLFNDANGQYLGFDRQVHEAKDFDYFTDLSLWDTFRTVHPLYTLITPKSQRDMLVSLVKMLEQGGWLPRWPSGRGYSNSMLGTPADIMIADSYLKGIRDFDAEKAYQAMRSTALGPTPPGAAFSGREGIEADLRYGYCPAGMVRQSVSRTLEYAWSDHAISLLAEALGHTQDVVLFRAHSLSYSNLWNPGTQYFQPRDAQGKFSEPFKPLLLTYLDFKGKFTRDYVEGSALQWRWGAPFDAPGLVTLFKDQDYFVNELDRFFSQSSPARGAWNPGPYYWHGNQPDIHAAYLFNEAGRPDLTQKWVRWILEHKYGDDYEGLDGNDDAGTLSAWYILSALGFYPEAGSDRYQLGAPLFEKAEVKLRQGLLTILAENYAPDRCYVANVKLNGSPLNRRWLRHSEIERGGILQFTMSPAPARK